MDQALSLTVQIASRLRRVARALHWIMPGSSSTRQLLCGQQPSPRRANDQQRMGQVDQRTRTRHHAPRRRRISSTIKSHKRHYRFAPAALRPPAPASPRRRRTAPAGRGSARCASPCGGGFARLVLKATRGTGIMSPFHTMIRRNSSRSTLLFPRYSSAVICPPSLCCR